MHGTRSLIGMTWFCMTNKEVRASLEAGRIQFVLVEDPDKSKE